MKCEGAVLIGAGAKVAGDISNSSTVEIQGFLEGNVVTNSLIVREGGGFKGEMQTQNAEVHGTVEGTLAVQDLLDIRATGRVSAEATYGKLAVSAGGCLAGNVQVKPPVILEDLRAESGAEAGGYNGSREGNGRAWTS
jgi:cytoskeletal protein CcmA (bactofilin family)